jgi:THO complex subunit 2
VAEKDAQDRNREAVLKRLESEKGLWFGAANNNFSVIVQHMILPRCSWSVADALFCAKFFLLVHKIGTPNFCTAAFLQTVVELCTAFLRGCTENEATLVARFMKEIFAAANRWRGAAAFEAEFRSLPGGTDPESPIGAKFLHEPFIYSCAKQQKGLNKVLLRMLRAADADALQTRNALLVAATLEPEFPIYYHDGVALHTAIHAAETHQREDVLVLAKSCFAKLDKRLPDLIKIAQKPEKPKAPALIQVEKPRAQMSSVAEKPKTEERALPSPSRPSIEKKPHIHKREEEKTPEMPHGEKREAPSTKVEAEPPPKRAHDGRHSHGGSREKDDRDDKEDDLKRREPKRPKPDDVSSKIAPMVVAPAPAPAAPAHVSLLAAPTVAPTFPAIANAPKQQWQQQQQQSW